MTTVGDDRSLVRSRVATTIAYGVQGLSLAILVTRTPTIKARLDLSDLQLGLLLLLVPAVAAIGSVIAGILSPRIGSRAVLRISGPIVPLSVVIVGFSWDLWLTVAALIVFGVALGATDATMNMQSTSVQHAYGRPIIASCYAWFSVASLAGALLASGAAAWDVPLGVFFLACAVVIVPVQAMAGRHLVVDVVIERHASPAPVPWLPVVLIGLGLMCAYVLDSAAVNWSAVFLTDQVAASEATAALGYGIYSLVVLACRVFVDRLDRRVGPVAIMRTAAGLGVIAVIVIAVAPGPAVALVGFAVLGLSVAPVFPLAFTAGASHDPDRSGRAVARINVFNYVGVLLGAPLIGVIADVSSLRIAFAALVVAPVVMLALARAYRASTI